MILNAVSISPGVASGRTYVVEGRASLHDALSVASSLSTHEELERLNSARGRALAQLVSVQRYLVVRGRSDDAAVFGTHATLLRDATLTDRIERGIRENQWSAEAAVARVVLDLERQFLDSGSSLLQEKVGDLLDIGQRLVRCLRGLPDLELAEHRVIVASTLSPSELVRAAHQGAIAFVTQSCGKKSHTAILARGFAIPLVTGVADILSTIPSGAEAIVDGDTGQVVIVSTDEERVLAESMKQRLASAAEEPLAAHDCLTRDGQRITVLLNISDTSEAGAVKHLEADGIGLYRTEFLYIDRASWPNEAESFQLYAAVAETIGDRELNIRLADFGAEKCPAYADIPINRNPSLGIRGIRLLLSRDDILRPQVKALERLGRMRPITVLLPMVDTLDTLRAIIDRLYRHTGCRTRKDLPFRLSMMVEVPAAALMIEEMLPHVDGVSIGLNDLTQYLLAADRDDELVEPYHDPLQPAVLRLLKRVIDAAADQGKAVTMCGELAGDPNLAPVLLGLGARRFSVSRSHYRQTIARVRQLDLAHLTQLAEEVLRLDSGRAVRRRLATGTSDQTRYP